MKKEIIMHKFRHALYGDIDKLIVDFNSARIGKYHYIYESKKGIISMIVLKNFFYDNKDIYQIHALKRRGFKLKDVVENYSSKIGAISRIKKLLS